MIDDWPHIDFDDSLTPGALVNVPKGVLVDIRSGPFRTTTHSLAIVIRSRTTVHDGGKVGWTVLSIADREPFVVFIFQYEILARASDTVSP